MITLSVIKADTGGWVGHAALHPQMVEAAVQTEGTPVAAAEKIAAS